MRSAPTPYFFGESMTRPSQAHIETVHFGPGASWWIGTAFPFVPGTHLNYLDDMLQCDPGDLLGLTVGDTNITIRYQIEEFPDEGSLMARPSQIKRQAVAADIATQIATCDGELGDIVRQLLIGEADTKIQQQTSQHLTNTVTIIGENDRNPGTTLIWTFYAAYSEQLIQPIPAKNWVLYPVTLKCILPATGDVAAEWFTYEY